MRTFKLLNVVKIVDTEAKARRLEMLGYKEVKEEAPIPEEVAAEDTQGLTEMVPQEGFEPPTPSLRMTCSTS